VPDLIGVKSARDRDSGVLQTCPLCDATKYRQLYRFEQSQWIPGSVVRCEGCQLIFKIPSDPWKPLTDYYNTSYAELDYWDHEEGAQRSLTKIRDFVTQVAPATGQTLLDIGCGPGQFIDLARNAGFTVTGLEYNPVLAARARARSGADIIEGDFLSIDLGDRRFDVVTMLDLIEHVSDPVAALARCRELLNPGGRLVVYTPNHASLITELAMMLHRVTRGRYDGPVREIFDCLHVGFFDERSLDYALKRAGLRAQRTVLLKYDPARSDQATGAAAVALTAIESASPLIRKQHRLLVSATKA
jgi:2-polyprenyl-3-methyl-5-hydroxy-6-metoxy-1,4-benzoquinol methylase